MFAKVFEQKWVIRFFGIALVLAPFFNIFNSVLEIPGINKSFLLDYGWQYFKSAPAMQQLLQVSSVVIGGLMLRGAISAWRYTLALLGAYIILQFTQLSSGARDNSTFIYLATNVVLFFFIADQLVLKPRPPEQRPVAKTPEQKPAVASEPVTSSATIAPPAAVAVASVQPISPIAPATHSYSPVAELSFPGITQDEVSKTESLPDFSSSHTPSPLTSNVIEMATPTGSVFVSAPQNPPVTSSTLASPAFTPAAPASEFAPLELAPPTFAPSVPHSHLPENHAPQLTQNVTPIAAHQSPKKVFVNFEGFGNWATISDISEAGIKVRAIAPAPPEITARIIELSLSANVNVRLKFHQQDGAEYTFAFVALSAHDKQSLNQWLLSAAA